MTLDIASYRRQLREHIGLTGDDVETLPDTDTADKTGADTYLNRSYWEVLDLFPVRAKEVIATFHTTQGRDFYKIPNSFEALQAISITDPNSFKHDPLDRIEKDYFEQKFVDRTDDEGKPELYFREGDGIRVWRRPDRDYEMTVHYWEELADLSNSNQTSPIPRVLHEVILFGGVWRAFIGVNGDYVRAQAAKGHQVALMNSKTPIEDKEKFDSHRAGVEVIGYDETNL